MGNRTYLMIKKENKFTCLFEGNNSLAMFWIMLMAPADIDRYVARMEEYNRLVESDELSEDFEVIFKLEREQALKRAMARRGYVEHYHPKAVKLFDDWLKFLANEVSDDNILYVDLAEYTWFYPTIEEFKTEFLGILEAIDNQSKVIFENEIRDLTGFEGWDNEDRFANLSVSYRTFEASPMIEAVPPKKHYAGTSPLVFDDESKPTTTTFNKKYFVVAIVLFLMVILLFLNKII